jgi:hypothetical protein
MTLILDVYVNGQGFAVAGEDTLSVLSAMVTASGKLGPKSDGVRRAVDDDFEVTLRVGGLTNRGNRERDEHLNWGPRLRLKLGDEVRVVLRQGGNYDPPSDRDPVQDYPHSRVAARKRFLEAKSLYFRMRPKFGTWADKKQAQWNRRALRRLG